MRFFRDKPVRVQQVQRKHAELDALQLAQDVAEIMALPAGRRVFMRLIVDGGVYRQSAPGEDRAYVAGRRDAALEVMRAVNLHSCQAALVALQEHNEKMERRNRELQAAQTEDQRHKREQ